MRCYLDNDALHKLAALGLLEDVLAALGDAKVQVLATARFRFMLNKEVKGRDKFGGEVWERIKNFLESAPAIENVPQEAVDRLTLVYGIDQGEAVLFAAAASDDTSVLLTGDKRSLEALQADPGSRELVARLKGRVLCVEQAIRLLIGRLGFEKVADSVKTSRLQDAALSIIFGGRPPTAATVDEGLASYIGDLRRRTGTLLRGD